MLAVVLAGDLQAVGFDSFVVRASHDRKTNVFVAAQDESVEGANAVKFLALDV